MKYHLVHTLVLTPFESTLTELEWDTVAAQDYPVHALYCEESKSLLFHSDNQKCDCMNEVSKIFDLLRKLAIEFVSE